MKTLIAVLSLVSISTIALGSSAPVPCKREMLVAALAQRVASTTEEFLLSSDFSIVNFSDGSHLSAGSYIVSTETKNRAQGDTFTMDYLVKVQNKKTCAVRAELLTD